MGGGRNTPRRPPVDRKTEGIFSSKQKNIIDL